MGNTTQANVLLIAPELSAVTDSDTWTLILADVSSEVSAVVFGIFQERAQRYLAAHYLTLISENSGASGAIMRKKTGDEEVAYSTYGIGGTDADYARTQYGRTYLSIKKKKMLGFQTVAP